MQSLLEIRRVTVTLPVSYHGHFCSVHLEKIQSYVTTKTILEQTIYLLKSHDSNTGQMFVLDHSREGKKRVSNYAPVVIICQGQDTHISPHLL